MSKKNKFAMVPPPQFMAEQGIGFFSMLHKTWRMGNLQSVIESQIALQTTRDAQMKQPYITSVEMIELRERFVVSQQRTKQVKWLTRSFKADAKAKEIANDQALLDTKRSEFEFRQLTAGEPKEEK